MPSWRASLCIREMAERARWLVTSRKGIGMSLIPLPRDARRTVIAPRRVSPEARLAMAMIERAIDDLAGRSRVGSDLVRSGTAMAAQREARRWIAGASGSLTFEDACILAGFEVQAVRERVLAGSKTPA